MKRTIIPAVFLIVLILSCERNVNNVILPDFVQKLVINSFISPRDTLSFVSVKSNEKLYGFINTKESLGNVSAAISDGTTEISLDRIEEGFIFRRRDMLLEEGKTYTLTVISDKGMQADASATIPFRRPLNIEVDTMRQFYDYGDGSGMGWTEFSADVFMTDYAGEENYYAFACKQILYNSEYSYYPYHIQVYQSLVFTDRGRDGERFFVSNFSFMDPSRDDSSDLVVYILNTDKAYYTYHHSLDNYSGGGDPFSEISPAYSNIEGGLGIFASYVVDSLVFKLK